MIVWLASYPRSGNTFFRIILNSVFNIKTFSLYNDRYDIGANKETSEIVGHQFLPDNFNIDYARNSKEIYYIKTHELFNKLNIKPTDRVIYLVRDGRESSLSFARYLKNFHNKDEELENILYGNTPYGSWGDHVRQWKNRDKLQIKFEEIIKYPASIIPVISKYLNISPLRTDIPTFETLQKINPKFFNSGKTDSWKKHFTDEEHLFYWISSFDEMKLMKYTYDIPYEINNNIIYINVSKLEKYIVKQKNLFLDSILDLENQHILQQNELKNKLEIIYHKIKEKEEYNKILLQKIKRHEQSIDLLNRKNQREKEIINTITKKNQTKEQYIKNQAKKIEDQKKNIKLLTKNKWYYFGQLPTKIKIIFIGKIISKKLKIYWAAQPIYKSFKIIFRK